MGLSFKYKLAIGLLSLLLVFAVCQWAPWKKVLPGGLSNWRWPSFRVARDTVFVDGPVQYIDRWHERVQYITQNPDTVTVVIYDRIPPTIDLVSASVSDDGELFVEVLVDSQASHVLRGRLAPSGDTHVVPDTSGHVEFVSQRFGLDMSVGGLCGLHGPGIGFETLYWNDVPFLHTTVHFPNVDVAVGWDHLRGDKDLEDAFGIGLSVDAEVAPFRSPLRVGAGALYDAGDDEIKFHAYAMLEIYNF